MLHLVSRPLDDLCYWYLDFCDDLSTQITKRQGTGLQVLFFIKLDSHLIVLVKHEMKREKAPCPWHNLILIRMWHLTWKLIVTLTPLWRWWWPLTSSLFPCQDNSGFCTFLALILCRWHNVILIRRWHNLTNTNCNFITLTPLWRRWGSSPSSFCSDRLNPLPLRLVAERRVCPHVRKPAKYEFVIFL